MTLSRGTDVSKLLGGRPRGRPVAFELRFLGGTSTRASGVTTEATVVGIKPADGSALIEGSCARVSGTMGSGLKSGATAATRDGEGDASACSLLGADSDGDVTVGFGDEDGGGCGVRNANGNVMASANVELREICAAVGGAGKTIGSSCIGKIA